MIEQWGLLGVTLSAFLSATILPGNSEVALSAYLLHYPQRVWPALMLASLANAAGSMTSYYAGRAAKWPQTHRAVQWMRRWGLPSLLLAWLPLIGDGLCLAAGWLRWPAFWSALLIFAGKFARYCVIALILV